MSDLVSFAHLKFNVLKQVKLLIKREFAPNAEIGLSARPCRICGNAGKQNGDFPERASRALKDPCQLKFAK